LAVVIQRLCFAQTGKKAENIIEKNSLNPIGLTKPYQF